MTINYEWRLSDLPQPKPNAPTVFSCFCGGGGSSMGYKLAGYNCLGGVEIDPRQAEYYRQNLNPRILMVRDIRELLTDDNLPSELYNLDVLDGSPPCTTFSISGKRAEVFGVEKKFREGQKMQTLDDLIFVFAELSIKLQPKIVVMENVPGLTMSYSRNHLDKFFEILLRGGYQPNSRIYDASTMGVPQARQRFFCVATRHDMPYIFLPDFDVREIPFSQISNEKNKKRTCNNNQYEQWRKKRFRFKSIAIEDWYSPAYTVKAKLRDYHPRYPRTIDDVELRQISTWPLDYQVKSFNQLHYLCGMSVPPLMMYRIAKNIRQYL